MKLKTIGAAVALGALVAGAAQAADSDHDWSGINILVLNWSQSSNPFFEAVNTGAVDAAED